jgi:hypothetical protein
VIEPSRPFASAAGNRFDCRLKRIDAPVNDANDAVCDISSQGDLASTGDDHATKIAGRSIILHERDRSLEILRRKIARF